MSNPWVVIWTDSAEPVVVFALSIRSSFIIATCWVIIGSLLFLLFRNGDIATFGHEQETEYTFGVQMQVCFANIQRPEVIASASF